MNSQTSDKLALVIETRVLGRSATRLEVDRLPARLTVRELLEAKTSLEWTQQEQGRMGAGAEYLETQSVSDRASCPGPRNAGGAIRASVDAFRAGWFIILIDGRQAKGLDETLELTANSRVAFVRLYPMPDAG